MSILCSKLLDSTTSAISNLLSDKINVYNLGKGSETIGYHTIIHDLKEFDFEVLKGYNKMFEYDLIKSIYNKLLKDDCNFNMRELNISFYEYESAIKEFKTICNRARISSENMLRTSRSFVVTFDSWHCFSCISFLIRNDVLFVNFHMKSCTVYNHLFHDIYFAYYLANIFSKSIKTIDIKQIDLNLSIDSLYIYNDKVDQCRKDVLQYVCIKK